MPPKEKKEKVGEVATHHGPDPEQCFADTKRRANEGLDWL